MKLRILLFALAGFIQGAFAQNVALSIGSGAGLAGSTVSLPLGIASTGGAQPTAVQWTFSFSPSSAVTSFSVDPGSSATSSGKSISCSVATGTCIVFSLTTSVIPDGALGTANIQLSGSATGTVTVSLTGTGASDTNSIPSTGGSGTINITPPAAGLSSLGCSPTSFSAAGTSTCTVNLTSTAGAIVGLSSNSARITVPANVTVNSGSSTAQFTATVGSFSADESPTITASLNSVTKTAGFSLTTVPTLTSIGCSAGSLSSSQSTTCTATLSKPATSATVVALSDSSGQLTTPASVTIPNSASSAQFTVNAISPVTSNETVTITGGLNGVNQTAQINMVAAALSSVNCNPNSFNASGSSNCTVTLTAPTTANTSVGLSSNSARVTVPANITINSGSQTAPFTATVASFSADEAATITASLNSGTRTANIALTTLPSLTSISCVAGSLNSNQSTTCTATLNKAAISSTVVSLSDSSAQLTVPASVTIPNGAASAQFTVTTGTVTTSQTVTVSGLLNGVTQSTAINLAAPAGLSGLSCNPNSYSAAGTATCTVSLASTAASNTSVTLSSNSARVTVPASVTVNSGASSAQFSATVTSFSADETATITASLNGGSQAANITLTTLPVLTSVVCSTGSLTSNQSLNCSVNLNKAAVGSTVVTLSDSSAQLNTPASATILNGQTSAQFTVTTGTVSASETATVTGLLNGISQTANITLTSPLPVLSSITCVAGSLTSNQSTTCTATLSKAAASATVVTLSDNSGQLNTPASVTIASSAATGQFTVTAGTIATSETATITGTLSGSTQSAQVNLAAPAGLSGLSCSPNSFGVAGTSTCTVNLGGNAGSNSVVTLSSNSPRVTVPANVTINSGTSTAQFSANIASFSADETATITASLNGGTQTANVTLTVLPALSSLTCPSAPLTSNQNMSCTVSLNKAAAGATVVTLSDNSGQLTTPANVTIANGQTSAQFTVTATSLTKSETATVTGTLNGLVQTAQVTLSASQSGLSNLVCSPSAFTAAGSATCTVSLSSNASANTTVTLSSSSARVTAPANVTITSGQSSAQFTANVSAFSADESVTISASLNGATLTAGITLSNSPQLTSVVCNAASLAANQTTTCVVALNKTAASNITVNLADNSSQLSTPASVTILSGQSNAPFNVGVGTITASETVTITATLNAITRSSQVVLAAPGDSTALRLSCSASTLSAGQSLLCDVILGVPAGDSVNVTLTSTNDSVALPASIVIPPGSVSAQFRIDGPATLSDGTMIVTASRGNSTSSFSITLKGGGTTDIQSLSCTPASLAAGESTLCTVTLSRAALNVTVINLSAADTTVTLPAQLTVQAGNSTGTFTAKVANITSASIATLYASYAGKQVSAVLNLTGPAVQPALQSFNCTPGTVPAGTSSFCTVTFTGRVVFPANLGISANSKLLQVPSQLTPAVGVSSVSFPIQAAASADTAQQVGVTLTWSGSAPQSQTIWVTPQASVALDAPSVVFTRAGQTVSFNVTLVRSSSFGAQVIANSLPEGATFQNMRFSWTPGADKIGEQLVDIRAVDNGGTTVSQIVRVVVRAAEATIDALVNPAGFTVSSECTANSVMTLLGHGFSLHDPEHASTVPLPTTLGGVRVRINGIYAPLLHVQDDLIHFQCPQLPDATDLEIVLDYEAAPPPPNGSTQSQNTLSVSPIHAKQGTAKPGIYIVGGTQGAVIENSSGLIAGPPNDNYPANPAAPGDFLVIYGNGMGAGTSAVAPGDVAPLDPLVYSTATVLVDFGNGIKAPASFAGLAPGFIGLFQVNVQIPSGTQLGMAIPITLEMQWPSQTLRSNSVTVAIQPR